MRSESMKCKENFNLMTVYILTSRKQTIIKKKL